MEDILVGKLLPNLKVTLGADEVETECSERDDGLEVENTDTDRPNVEIVRSWMKTLQNPKVYKNKSGGFTTGLDLTSEESIEKLGKRAERFGLEKEEISVTPNILELYESMDIDIENRNSAKMKNMRLDALHMRGVNDLNTNQIFDYFKDFGPASVEWINDFSCNVVWLDETSCARALLAVSKPLSKPKANTAEKMNADTASESEGQISSDENDSKEESAMLVDGESDVKTPEASLDIPVPPGHWRLGAPHPKAKTILLRFATKDDKKIRGAEKRSDYYKKYGNPNYGGLRGLISGSRKRKMQAAISRQAVEKESKGRPKGPRTPSPEESVSKSSSSSKPPPRMRMYADDEELKSKKLRITNSFVPKPQQEKKRSVHSRLGTKYTRDDLCHLSSTHYSTDDCAADPLRRRREDSDSRDSPYDDDEARPVSRHNNPRWSYRGRRQRQELPVRSLREGRSGSTGDSVKNDSAIDLRTKLKRLRRDNLRLRPFRNLEEEEDVRKHRSPLCADSSGSEED